MKLIHCLFAIYLILLSCLPCADMKVSSLSFTSNETTSISEKHSHEDKHSNDLCSPFCVCSCCGVQMLSHFTEITFENNRIILVIKTSLPTYNSILSSNFYGSIWQPPQIV